MIFVFLKIILPFFVKKNTKILFFRKKNEKAQKSVPNVREIWLFCRVKIFLFFLRKGAKQQSSQSQSV
jgi:hypothetical protein